MADEYLSGNVRGNARGKSCAALDDSFQENVVALESVIPPDLKDGIRAPLGAGWIPVEYIRQFILHLLKDGEYKVAYLPHLAHWEIEDLYRWRISDSLAKSRWGTQRIHALELIDAGLNARSVTIWDQIDEKTRVVNQMETVAAQAKLGEIKDEFEKWLWSDPERATELRALYNEQFNAFCARRYDGSHLSTPGLNRNITLRPHQKNVVWRILQNQSTAVDHRVGAGKTLAGIVAAMEAKRLRLVKKTMIVVPNHLLSQWQLATLAAYPGANILAPSPTDFEKTNRGEFLSKIATNDWDIVLVPFSSFKLIPVSRKTMEEFYQREIDTLETYLYELKAEAGKSPSRATKEIEKNKKRFEAKLEALADMKKDDRGTITFEEMGVEMLIVDEFHAFKNLFFQSRMTRIAGLNNSDSQRAFDMFMKMIWMQEHGYKTVPMSGTFIVNTIAEFFTMQKFTQLETLKSLGIAHFDAWANQFALAEPGLEMTPDGSGFRMNTRFRKFVNVPELMKIWLQVADVYVIDETSGIERPDLINGKPVKVLSDGGEELVQYVKELATRAEKVRSGLVRPDQDNMLVITSDGRKAALDLSLVIPKPPDSPMPKIDELVNLVVEIYNSTSPIQATQLIFCDLATPKAKT
jgi:N12 class adenine-specific DNA methylase